MNHNELVIREITTANPYKLCFVCLGNICRSPTAEGVMQHLVQKDGLSAFIEVDSAGTAAYHIGEPANNKSRMVAEEHGIKLHSKARKFEYPDLEYFDMILAMDRENVIDLQKTDFNNLFRQKIFLFRDYDPFPDNREVPDPYYGGINGFELVFEIVLRSCENLLSTIKPYIKQ